MKNYQQEIMASCEPGKLFSALTVDLPLWWGKVDKPIFGAGDDFTIYFGKAHWHFLVVDFVPNERLTWKCIGGEPDFNREWVGTSLQWNLKPLAEKTKLTFVHYGLTPEFSCYDICAPAWDKYIVTSLKSFIETGEGMPG